MEFNKFKFIYNLNVILDEIVLAIKSQQHHYHHQEQEEEEEYNNKQKHIYYKTIEKKHRILFENVQYFGFPSEFIIKSDLKLQVRMLIDVIIPLILIIVVK